MKVRNEDVTLSNIIVLILSPGFSLFLGYYYSGTQVYNLQYIYGIDKDTDRLSVKLGTVISIGKAVGILLNFLAGPIYDTIGRKLPVLVLYACTSLGLFMIPLGWGAAEHTPFKGYLVGWILLQTNIIISYIPFVPDLIKEESQGIANGVQMLSIAICGILIN
jgi:MFS family permease